MISIIVPALDEESALRVHLPRLLSLRPRPEVIVVDGGSADATVAVARERGAKVVEAPRGRGTQMNAGARAASGEILVFLHADCWLDEEALQDAERMLRTSPIAAGVYRQRIEGRRWTYRWIEWVADRRAQWLRMPYGDSALFLLRERFEQIQGYPDHPLCEDLGIALRLRRQGRIGLAPSRVHLSDRRWRQRGLLRTSWRNWRIAASYLLGVSPERLYHAYYGVAAGSRGERASSPSSSRSHPDQAPVESRSDP